MTTLPFEIHFRSHLIDDIVPSGASLERLAGGFMWAEGPVWLPDENVLLFSDVSGNTIYTWDNHKGVAVYRRPSSYANGNTLDLQGRLITCEHATRRVSRTEADRSVRTLASCYGAERLNSPNDVVVRSDGTIYFTDPPYGFTKHMGSSGKRELDIQGVFRISPGDNALTLEVSDFQSPNGLAFSPDERYLYVNDSDRMHIRFFDVSPHGSLNNGRVFAELDPNLGPGWPDGLKTDSRGNVYVTGPTGIWIFDSLGNHLGIFTLPETATNMNWGGAYRNELYITTATEIFQGSFLYRLKLAVQGHFCV